MDNSLGKAASLEDRSLGHDAPLVELTVVAEVKLIDSGGVPSPAAEPENAASNGAADIGTNNIASIPNTSEPVAQPVPPTPKPVRYFLCSLSSR